MSRISKNADVSEKNRQKESTSRRDFVKAIPLAGLGALAMSGKAGAQIAQEDVQIDSIRIPLEVDESRTSPPSEGEYSGEGKSGAEVFASMCKEEGLSALFCAAGNYSVINAIAQSGVPSYGGRSEGAMAAAADGYSRVTGEVAACSGTEGPGFTHMIQAIYTAKAAHQPLLVLASNMLISMDDSETSIQVLDQQPLTTGIKKYGKRLITPNRVYEYGGYAFRQLKSGVPGPVHLDFPGEVARERFADASELVEYTDKSKYRSESRAAPAETDMRHAIDLITKAERPLIIAGQGIFQRNACAPLLEAVEHHEIAVCATGPMKGHFPDDHRLAASLSPRATLSADLIIFIGQYQMPTRNDFRVHPDVTSIRVHPVQEELGRNWPLDVGIVSDELLFLEELASRLPRKVRPQWTDEIAAARKAYQDQLDEWYRMGIEYGSKTNALHPSVIGRELNKFFYHGNIDPLQTLHIWGGLTACRFIPAELRSNRPAQGVNSYYQSGTIGSELNHGIGATAAVKEGVGPQAAYKGAPVLAVASDASMAYGLLELETAAKYRLPLISVVYNNNAWGNWTSADQTPRAKHMYLFQENLRYDTVAEALGCHGEYVRTPEQLREALERSYNIAVKENIPCLINAQAIKEFSSPTLYPPGVQIVPGPHIAAVSH